MDNLEIFGGFYYKSAKDLKILFVIMNKGHFPIYRKNRSRGLPICRKGAFCNFDDFWWFFAKF